MAVIRTKPQWITFALFLLALAVFPFFASQYIMGVAITIAIYIVAAMGLNIITGFTGLISMANSAFMAIGAFTTGVITVKLGLSHWIALPFAGLIAGLVGVFFGVASFRVKGLYLALITIGAQFIIMYVLLHWNSLTGGVTGLSITPPNIGSFAFDSNRSLYFLSLVTCIVVVYLARNIARSKVGRAFIAVRDNDVAAEVMGVNVRAYKTLSFFVGCFFTGIGGWLWCIYIGVASVDHYTLLESIWFLAILVIGGMGSVLGTIMGVVFVEILKEVTVLLGPVVGDAIPAIRDTIGTALPLLVLGGVVLAFLIYEPRGLVHRWEIVKRSYRLWPYSR